MSILRPKMDMSILGRGRKLTCRFWAAAENGHVDFGPRPKMDMSILGRGRKLTLSIFGRGRKLTCPFWAMEREREREIIIRHIRGLPAIGRKSTDVPNVCWVYFDDCLLGIFLVTWDTYNIIQVKQIKYKF